MFSSEENSKKAVSFKADSEKLKTWDQLDIASLSSEENIEVDSEKADSEKPDIKKADSEKADSKKAVNEKADGKNTSSKNADSKKGVICLHMLNEPLADSKKEINEKANSKKAAIEKFASDVEKAVSEIEKVVNEKAVSEKSYGKKAVNEKADSKKDEIEKVVSGIEKVINEKAASETMRAVKKTMHPLLAFVFPEPPKEPPTEPVTEFQNLAGSLVEPLREPRPRLLSGTELIPLNEFSNINRNPNPNPNTNPIPNPNVPTEPPKKPLTEFQKLAGSLVEPPKEPRIRALSGTEKIPLNEFPNLNLNPNPNLNQNPNPNPNVPQRTLSMTRIDNLSMESLPDKKIIRGKSMPLQKKLHKKNKYSNVLTFPF